ncbi:sensor histidine kinase [Sphingobium nicotianae]|uniref:sensor histidine kinase n=1 Tax=Sphingobium nicotianae TaxID=2782607 RepID=UPI00203298DC|nr:HAMP domain-containing sensor histidine kinase [Sphingobium nicotianae]
MTVLFLSLLLAVTILAGLGTFFVTLSTIDALVDQRIESESHALAPPGVPVTRPVLERRIEDLGNRRDTGDLGLLLTNRQGDHLAGNVALARNLPLGFSSLDRRDQIEGLTSGRAFVRDIGNDMHLAVFAETEPIDHYFAARLHIYMIAFGAIVVVILAGLLQFRRLIGQRIVEMRQTVDSIIEGDLTQRVPLSGDGGEFDQQAAAFNRMLDWICHLLAEMRNVSNNISHELRTPLAKLRNELALLEQQANALPIREQLIEATKQADDLLGMFRAMLRIAEIESGSRRAAFQPVHLGALVMEVADMMQPVAEDAGKRLGVGRCDDAWLTGDHRLLSQMLLNLVENGLRHTPLGTGVAMSVNALSGRSILIVQDDGPGIPADQRALVMRPFGRLDRSQTARGHGLGLPLVDAIVRLHGGTLTLDDARPGLKVTIDLPRSHS